MGEDAVRPRGHLARRRPPADRAPALPPQRRPPGQGCSCVDGGELIARILGVDDEGLDLEVPGVKGRKPTARRLAFAEIAKARVEVEFNRKDSDDSDDVDDDADLHLAPRSTRAPRRRSRGHRHECPAGPGAGEGDLVRPAGRGDRVGAPHRVPPRAAGSRRRRPGGAGPQHRARDGVGQGGRRARLDEGAEPQRVRRHPVRLRPDRRDHRQAGHPAAAAGRRGRRSPSASTPAARATSSPAWSSRARTRKNVLVDIGKLEAILPAQEQVPGEEYKHGTRLRTYVVRVRQGRARPVGDPLAHPPQPGEEALRAGGARRSPTARWRSRRSPARPDTAPRSRCARPGSGLNAKGACIGPMGGRVRDGDGRAARREDRHRRLVGRPGARWWPTRCRPPG